MRVKQKDESWKGFKTFIGVTLIAIHVILLLARLYNISNLGYDCNLACITGLDSGSFLYLVGYNFLIGFGLLFLYLENKEITKLMRYILVVILVIIVLSILGF